MTESAIDDGMTDITVGGTGPKWTRTACLAENGDVYMPAAVAGNERTVFLCAAYDGEPVTVRAKHLFVRTKWVASEYPKIADLAQKIEARVREHTRLIGEEK